MVDRMTVVVGVLPRISLERFRWVLAEARSPALPEAEASYWAVARLAVDPLFALAVFRHESNFGTRGICASYGTRNPGNTRSTRTGHGEIIKTERGQFVRYPSWEEGFRDLAFRLVDPNFVYAQRQLQTIEEIIPVWAPASDGNSPNSYIAGVVTTMQRLEENLIGVPYRVSLIPKGNRNRPGLPMTARWITVHETANTAPGANAEAHRRFAHAGGGPEGVSFHFVVDDKEVIQLLPLTENGWHAGDGYNGEGNRASVGIETCVNADGNWERTLANLVKLLAALCRYLGLGVDRIVQHNHWSGKDCPKKIRSEGRWNEILQRVAAELGATPQQEDAVIQIGPFGRHLGHGFLAFWRQLESIDATLPLRVLGWPLTEEFAVGNGTYQVFERAVLKYVAQEQEPWRVHLALLPEAVAVREEAAKRGLLPG